MELVLSSSRNRSLLPMLLVKHEVDGHSVTAGTGTDTLADTMSTARSRHSATAGPGVRDYATTSSLAIARSVAEVP